MKDYYNILGLTQNATYYDIAEAYRKLSSKYYTEDQDEIQEDFVDQFKEIQEAYENLSNGKKRKEHDTYLSQLEKLLSEPNKNEAPEIDYFQSDKLEFDYGDKITFKWRARNANKLTLKPFGAVNPTGSASYEIKEFRSKILTFELIAENSFNGKQTKQSLALRNKSYDEFFNFFKKEIEKQFQKEIDQKKIELEKQYQLELAKRKHDFEEQYQNEVESKKSEIEKQYKFEIEKRKKEFEEQYQAEVENKRVDIENQIQNEVDARKKEIENQFQAHIDSKKRELQHQFTASNRVHEVERQDPEKVERQTSNIGTKYKDQREFISNDQRYAAVKEQHSPSLTTVNDLLKSRSIPNSSTATAYRPELIREEKSETNIFMIVMYIFILMGFAALIYLGFFME